jgi:hypothetical protein
MLREIRWSIAELAIGTARNDVVRSQNAGRRSRASTTRPALPRRPAGVRYLVRGSVRRETDRLRVVAELIESETGHQLWAQQYDREVAGAFAVQDELTEKIVGTLVAPVSPLELAHDLRTGPSASASKPAGVVFMARANRTSLRSR